MAEKEMSPDEVVRAVVKSVTKSVGHISLGVLGRPEFFVDSGNYALNWCISGLPSSGGYPGGRVTELFGDPSTGKSLLVYHALAYATRHGGYGVLDDTEGAYIDVYGEAMGIDNSRLIPLNSVTVEEHFTVIREMRKDLRRKVGPDVPIVIALDSLAQLTTEHERTVQFEKPSLTKAKTIKLAFRLFRPELVADPKTVYLIANHVIANIGDMYHPTTTPGGGGPKFQSSVRLELGLGAKISEGEKRVGVNIRVEAVKNKICPPFKKAPLQVRFDKGVVRESGLFEAAKIEGVITPSESKGWCRMQGVEKKFQQADFYKELVPKVLELMGTSESTPE